MPLQKSANEEPLTLSKVRRLVNRWCVCVRKVGGPHRELGSGVRDSLFITKIDGIALGPKLTDESSVLIVTSDNDFKSDEPTEIFAFAIK